MEQLKETAKQCGAMCLPARQAVEQAEATTHVVALGRDSNEAAWGLGTGRSVVRPAWLLCCAHTWYKAREQGLSV